MRASEFSAKTKLQGWERCHKDGKPHCEICGLRILGRGEYDHRVPVGLGGASDLDNLQVLCRACHKHKTHEEDRPIMAKADNQKKSAAGIKRKYPWPKRKMSWNPT